MIENLDQSQGRQKLVKASKMHIAHWLIVLLSVVLTISAWQFSKNQLNQKLEAKFERYAEQTIHLVIERMKLYENALWSGVAYIDVFDKEVTNSEWVVYANSLKIDKTYPGINGIGIIYNIQPNQLDTYLSIQRELRPNYTIHPNHSEPEYWPITYVEPAIKNKQAIGLDMAFETNRYTSIKKSRDTGMAQLTGPITLVQDEQKTPGFLFYTPFYKDGAKPVSVEERRRLISGVTYAPFIMKNLMEGTLAKEKRQVSMQIYDGVDLLYDESKNSISLEYDNDPLFTQEKNIDLYGRVWSFKISSNKSFKKEYEASQSTFILVGGLIIDTMLLGVFLFLSRANRQALKYADEITAQLKKKTFFLEKSNNDLEQFSYVASHDLKSPLNSIKQISGWLKEDCYDVISDESKIHLDSLVQRSERMMKLLNDLLNYSRVNQNTFETEEVNLKHFVKDVENLLSLPDDFSINVVNEVVEVSKAPFEIVIRNLLSNAIKHHDKEHGTILVTYEKINDFNRITVEDDGPGISPQFHEKVTEMFQTLKSRDKVEGSGMGLAMVKKIMTHYHGDVVIDSDGIRGTKVTILWPI